MNENSQQQPKQYDWLKAYQWVKGQSGNPGGRPKKSMKDFAREFLSQMSEEDRVEYFKSVSPETVWKMAEGNPHQDNRMEHTGEVHMHFDEVFDETSPSSKTDNKGQA